MPSTPSTSANPRLQIPAIGFEKTETAGHPSHAPLTEPVPVTTDNTRSALNQLFSRKRLPYLALAQEVQTSSEENLPGVAASQANSLEIKKQKTRTMLSEILQKLEDIDGWTHFSPAQKNSLKRVIAKTKEILSDVLRKLPNKTTEAEINQLLDETDCKLSGTSSAPCNLPNDAKSQLSIILDALNAPLRELHNSRAELIVKNRIVTLTKELRNLRRMLEKADLAQPLTEANQSAIRSKIDELSEHMKSERSLMRSSLSGIALEKVEAFYDQYEAILSQMSETITGTTFRTNQDAYNALELSSLHALVHRLFSSLVVSLEQRNFLRNLLSNIARKVARS